MDYIWWILPALSGVVGLMLSFAGIGRLLKLRLAAGGLRFLFGVGFLGVAGVTTFAGLNLQTYERLTYERVVATISFEGLPAEGEYRATLLLPEGETVQVEPLSGDQFSIGARVITFKPLAQLLGYDSVYRLDYIEGRRADRFQTNQVNAATSTGQKLTENPGLDVYALAREQGKRFGVDTQQKGTSFGSAVYAPMSDGLEYDVSLTQTALVLRPRNSAAAASLQDME